MSKGRNLRAGSVGVGTTLGVLSSISHPPVERGTLKLGTNPIFIRVKRETRCPTRERAGAAVASIVERTPSAIPGRP